jgi:PAS domain S-box-containing protein
VTAELTILLVDDNPADAWLVREMLKDASSSPIAVTHVARFADALASLRTQRFSAMLLDLTLPDSAGLDTFVRALAEAPHTPIVVLTGIDDEAVAAKAVQAGAQDYLVKGQVDGRLLYQSLRFAVERHASAEALRASEERFRQLADNIKEAFLVIELPGWKALYLSRMWEEISGRSLDEAYRDFRIWFDAIHPDDRASARAAQSAIERGEPAAHVFRLVRPDGALRWVRARTFPVFNTDRHVYRLVGLVEDITEIRQTEQQLLQSQKMEAVGRLAGGIAHDFNNLLTAILGYAAFASEDLGPAHESAADIRQIQAAGQSAASLTRQLLAFSRRQILQPQDIDLNDVVRRVDALLRRVVGEDIALHMKLTTPLARVHADPGQIEQVVMNLAVNARDAMPEGGHLTIETANVELDQRYVDSHGGASVGAHVMVAVTDSGTGIDEATQKRLFEPFFTTKELGKGTGLGLATVYGIVKQSHGSISVYSEVGTGSSFKIYLPATPAAPGEPASAEAAPVSLVGTETVLVVEDHVDARAVIGEMLRRHGYTVVEATSGPDAIAKSRRHEGAIHVLLTDVVMPGMSGRRVAELLHVDRQDLRVIYMSGYTDDAIVHHGVLDAGLAFVQKPFTAEALLRKIRDVLDAAEPPQ